jgi:hypothetical protein
MWRTEDVEEPYAEGGRRNHVERYRKRTIHGGH